MAVRKLIDQVAPALPALPELPAELAQWRWSTNPKTGHYFLMHPKHPATFTTRHYPDPADAIAEARRWVLSQPKLGPGQPPPEPWPDAPDGWRWNRRGAPAHLIAADGWKTANYNDPQRALAEATQYSAVERARWGLVAVGYDIQPQGMHWYVRLNGSDATVLKTAELIELASSLPLAVIEQPPTPAILSADLEELARRYLGAMRRSGEALLEASSYVREARDRAAHGDWKIWLEATGTSEAGAEQLLNIYDRASTDPAFAEAINRNFLGRSTAALLARPSTPPEVIEQALSQPAPPTVGQVREAIAASRPAANPDTYQDLDASHIAAAHKILATLDQWDDSARPGRLQEAYSHAREVGDVSKREALFAAIDRAVEGTPEPAAGRETPAPIIRITDTDGALFDRAEATRSISDGYLNRGKIKRPFEYDGKLWISVGGAYGGSYHDYDECECVRVVLEGEPYTPGEPNKSFRAGSYTHDRATAGGKTYVLTGQWLIIRRPNAAAAPAPSATPEALPEASDDLIAAIRAGNHAYHGPSQIQGQLLYTIAHNDHPNNLRSFSEADLRAVFQTPGRTVDIVVNGKNYAIVPTHRIKDLALHHSVSHPAKPMCDWSITYVPNGGLVGPGFATHKQAEAALQELAKLDWSGVQGTSIPPGFADQVRPILARSIGPASVDVPVEPESTPPPQLAASPAPAPLDPRQAATTWLETMHATLARCPDSTMFRLSEMLAAVAHIEALLALVEQAPELQEIEVV